MQNFAALFSYQLWSFRATWPPLLLAGLAILTSLILSNAWIHAMAAAGVLVLFFDSAARLRQFERVRHLIRRTGGLEGRALREFREARSSWCSRRAAMAAAAAEGFAVEARELVAKWGYRPWHIFPDRAFSRRSPFLRLAFWKSVLGISGK